MVHGSKCNVPKLVSMIFTWHFTNTTSFIKRYKSTSLPAKYADSVDLKDRLLNNKVGRVKFPVVESYFLRNATHTELHPTVLFYLGKCWFSILQWESAMLVFAQCCNTSPSLKYKTLFSVYMVHGMHGQHVSLQTALSTESCQKVARKLTKSCKKVVRQLHCVKMH